MDTNLTLIIIFSLTIILIVLLMFHSSILFLKCSEDEKIGKDKIIKSYVEVNIKKSIVIYYNVETLEKKEFLLNNYIYMLSKNLESKNFRDFLRLINNKSNQLNIKKKLELLENEYIFEIKYSENDKKIIKIFLNNISDDSGIVKFQIIEYDLDFNEVFLNKQKENYKKMSEDEIFNLVKKDVNKLNAKRWTLIKIDFKNKSINTKKEYDIEKIQLEKILILFKKLKISAYLHEDNYIYVVSKTGKSHKQSSIWKFWNHFIESKILENKNDLFSDIDIMFSDFEISTSGQKKKDDITINEAFVKVSYISEMKSIGNNTFKDVENIDEKASKVSKTLKNLNLEIFENKKFLKTIEYDIREKLYKGLIEVYLNLPFDETIDLFKYSAIKKVNLLRTILNETIKISYENPEKIVTFIFSSKLSYLISRATNDLDDPPSNFYISFSLGKEDNIDLKWRETFEIIRKNNFNLLQFIRYSNKNTTKFYRDMEPKIIIFSNPKDSSILEEQESNINNENLIKNINKDIKILNIK